MQFATLLAKKPAEASNPGPINAYIMEFLELRGQFAWRASLCYNPIRRQIVIVAQGRRNEMASAPDIVVEVEASPDVATASAAPVADFLAILAKAGSATPIAGDDLPPAS